MPSNITSLASETPRHIFANITIATQLKVNCYYIALPPDSVAK